MSYEKKLARDLNSLAAVGAFLDDFISRHKLDEAIAFAIRLAVEELFTNIVKHQEQNPHAIGLSLAKKAGRIVIKLVDHNSARFDITTAPAYDPTRPIEERRPGGMGIHLVKNFVDKIDYDYKNGSSIITLVKYLETSDARNKKN